MKFFKKRALSFALAVTFIVSSFMTAPLSIAASDSLGTASSWARESIISAVERGFVPAELQNNYSNVITRAEFCLLAVKYMEYTFGKDIEELLADRGLSRNPDSFTDTSDPDILAAFALGITNGTGNNQFTPDGQFSREQAAAMIMNTCAAMGKKTDDSPSSGFNDIGSASDWAVDGIDFVFANGIMQGTGDNMFSPKDTYTREQSIITFNNMADTNAETAYSLDPGSIKTDADTQISYVDNIVLIFFHDGVDAQRKNDIVASVNGTVAGRFDVINQYQVQITAQSFEALQSICEQLNALPEVLEATYDRAFKLDTNNVTPVTPDDPWSDDNWDEGAPSGNNWWLEAIQAPSAWSYSDRLNAVEIGIVDNGFDAGHEDLEGKISFPDKTYEDVNNKEDHGSHVAGIIGAGANNQKGITGIIWDSELICFDWEPTWLQQTFTDWSTETFIASGLINCVKSGAKVINFSLGTSGSLTDSNQTFSEDTINGWGYLASLYMASLLYQGYDFVVVQSAGNGASDGIGVDAENNGWFASVSRENCYDRLGTADDILNRIIIVGAVQQDGASYTQASFSNGGATVDICAPGVDIYSSVTGGFRGKYENMSGTSMASPIAAGVAGMVWAAAPGLSGAEVKAIVCGNGNTIHNAADNAASPNAVGVYRMVNAKLAVEAVLGTGQERDVTNELNLTGNAVTDESGAILLCPAVTNSNGSALFDDDLSDNFNISFDYKIGGGTGADGIVFAFFTDEIIPDMVGEYMMFNGNNGYGIEFDGYLNRNDSANPHIALIHLEVSNHLFAVDDVRAEDNEWHSVNVRVEGDSISVAVDGGIVIDYSGAIDKTNKCMYFAASTGSYTNDHYIKNVMLTELN